MEFYTNFKKPPRKQETFTNQMQKIYEEKIDSKTGKRKLIEKEEINIVDKIQEYAEETKISNLIAKYNADMIKQIAMDEEKIIDLTNLPQNLAESLSIIDEAKKIWNNQSVELKQKFNNDFNQFVAGAENGQLTKILQEKLNTEITKFNIESQANLTQEKRETIAAQQQEILKQQEQLKGESINV